MNKWKVEEYFSVYLTPWTSEDTQENPKWKASLQQHLVLMPKCYCDLIQIAQGLVLTPLRAHFNRGSFNWQHQIQQVKINTEPKPVHTKKKGCISFKCNSSLRQKQPREQAAEDQQKQDQFSKHLRVHECIMLPAITLTGNTWEK